MSGTPPDDALIRAAIGWDVRNWSRALAFWQRHLDDSHPRRALALGERGGGLSLWLASQGIEVSAPIWRRRSTRLGNSTNASGLAPW